jgi:sulfate transport system permease protein
LLFLAIFLVAPIATVFASAFSKGVGPYWAALAQDETLDAIKLTLLTAGISVPLNVVFGVAAAWLISKYDFWGKSLLITVVDLPFSVSPVISGLIFVLLFGAHVGLAHGYPSTTSRSFLRSPASSWPRPS